MSEGAYKARQGTDREIANWIKENFQKVGMDFVREEKFEAFLSFADGFCPNRVELLDANNDLVFSTVGRSADYATTCSATGSGNSGPRQGRYLRDDDPRDRQPYSAYARRGEFEGLIVYANYGTKEDFRYLRQTANMELSNRIAIVRTGRIHVANKVFNAQEEDLRGLIIYSDPDEVAREGRDVIPDSIWLPGDGVRLGHVHLGRGDPSTPGWASMERAHRLDPSKVDTIPNIAVQPVSYDAAKTLLQYLAGPDSPPDWKGGLERTTYKLGGAFSGTLTAVNRAKLSVFNGLELVDVANVIATIRGAVEPDRYVVVGSHRDSWGPGAADPAAGTAAVLSAARAFRRAMDREGWRPRRTVVFASWGAGEFGAVGSTEWLERRLNKMAGRAVAYLNSDFCVAGSDLAAAASPALKRTMVDVIKGVKDPTNEQRSYYEYWAGGHLDGGSHGRWGSYPVSASPPDTSSLSLPQTRHFSAMTFFLLVCSHKLDIFWAH